MKHYIFNHFNIETYGQAQLIDSKETNAILMRGNAKLKAELAKGVAKAEALPRIAHEVYEEWKALCYRGFLEKLELDQVKVYKETILASRPDGEGDLFISLGPDLTFNLKKIVADWEEKHSASEVG